MEHSERVEIRAYLERLCAHLGDAFRELRPIAVKVAAEELYLPPEQAIPLGLIVNELVTNSLKHAFRDNHDGAIEVILTRNSAKLRAGADSLKAAPVRAGLGVQISAAPELR